jgi:hypothetical protein
VSDNKKLSESASADLQARIKASQFACNAARARNDLVAADRHWKEHIGLLEVQMGRTGSPERLTPDVRPETKP